MMIILDQLEGFFKILNSDRDQEDHENYINGCSEKSLVCPKWGIVGPKMKSSQNSGFDVSFF